MKLVQDLPEIFEEFGEKKREAFLEIKEYKDKGIPVIGMYCAYFPTELAMAAGAIPVGLCSFSNETITAAERDLPKSMCPLVKSSYGFAISDRCPFFHFADLVIGETTCDGKKKMYELMAEFKPVHVMELPNSQSERGLAFWKSEIIRTKEYLEEFFHMVITEEMIRDAVHLNNQIRTSLKNLCEVMKLDPVPVRGEDIQKMVQGSKYRFDFATTPGVVKEVIDKIMTEYRQGKHLEKRPRILVTGCPIGGDSLKVIRAIEDNGGVVVAIENCSGVRTLGSPVEEDCEDIYEAIARKYLSTGCSIMTPNDNRIDLIGEIIEEYHVDGVVEMILTGCHATGAESVYIRKFVTEEKHLPYIAIDTDYSTADQGQIATRLTAFLEMIQPETRHRPRSSRIYAESMARPRSKYPLKKPPAENVRKNTRARIPKNMGIPHTGWARSRSARSVKESNTLPTLGSVFLLFCAGLPLYRIQAAANRRARSWSSLADTGPCQEPPDPEGPSPYAGPSLCAEWLLYTE